MDDRPTFLFGQKKEILSPQYELISKDDLSKQESDKYFDDVLKAPTSEIFWNLFATDNMKNMA